MSNFSATAMRSARILTRILPIWPACTATTAIRFPRRYHASLATAQFEPALDEEDIIDEPLALTSRRRGRRKGEDKELNLEAMPSESSTPPKQRRRKTKADEGSTVELVPPVAPQLKGRREKKGDEELNVQPAPPVVSQSKGRKKEKADEELSLQPAAPVVSQPKGLKKKKADEELNLQRAPPVASQSKGRRRKKADEELAAPPMTPLQIKLRDYQHECIEAVLDHVRQGHKRLGVSLATGSGKTVIFTQLIDRLPPLNSEATQTLILVHRRELVEQALRHCTLAYPDKVVEVEMANKHATGVADITVASVQSICSKDRIEKFDPKKFKLVLIDECHHAVSNQYLETLDHFGALHPEPGRGDHPVVVGVSATLSRHDGLKIGTIIDYIVYHKDYVDMINDKWLSDVLFTTVHTEVDLSGVRATGGDFNLSELSLAVNTDKTNEVTVRAWLEKAGTRKSTLVFCVDLAHVYAMTNMFRKHGIDARYVTSLTRTEVRAQGLQKFKNGEFPVLVNCGIFTEGTDIPNIDCVVLARPTRSRNLLIQMIGRGMRLSPQTGKKDCHIIDMVGMINKGIITTPTLFGLDPFAMVDKATPKKLEEMAKEGKVKPQSQPLTSRVPDSAENRRALEIKSISFTDYDSIFDLLEDTSHDTWIRQISPHAWVKVGPDDYVLAAKGGTLKVEKGEDGKYSVTEILVALWNRYAEQWVTRKPRLLSDQIDSLEHAVRGADSYAQQSYAIQLIMHSAPWRKTPASEAQLQLLAKIKPDGKWEDKKVTKGFAVDFQTRIKYGKAKWQKIFKQAEKVKRTIEKEEAMMRRHEVKVGKVLH